MNSVKLLSIFLLIICFQRAEFKIVENEAQTELDKTYPIAKNLKDTKGLKEVWNNIKESALSSWNYIKELAENAKDRIKEWMQSAQSYAKEIRLSFKDQLAQLREKMDEIINDLYGTSGRIKECYEQEKPRIQGLLSEITSQMGGCIMNEVKKLMQINTKAVDLSLNDTQYVNELEAKFEACEHDLENVEECMRTVRNGVFEDMKEIENKIMDTSNSSRGLVDNVKNTLVTCSLNNLADASYIISNEMMAITKCVMESSSNNGAGLLPEIKPIP